MKIHHLDSEEALESLDSSLAGLSDDEIERRLHEYGFNKIEEVCKERLINWRLLARAYLFLGVIEAVAAMSAYYFVLHEGGWHYGEMLDTHNPLYLQATTACLTAIIMMQVVNVFICKRYQHGIFQTSILNNPLIISGVLIEISLILLIDYTPWGNAIFATAPLNKEVWLFILPFALGLLLLEELRKWVVRKFKLFPERRRTVRLHSKTRKTRR